MPPALLKAHQKLDTAVDAAYQPSGGKKSYTSDAERVAFLFELYQRISRLLPATAGKKTRKTRPQKAKRYDQIEPVPTIGTFTRSTAFQHLQPVTSDLGAADIGQLLSD